MNRNAGTAQLVAAMANGLHVDRLVVVAVVVALCRLAAINADLFGQRRQYAGDDGASHLGLTDSTAQPSHAGALPTTLGVAVPRHHGAAGHACNFFVVRAHLSGLAPEYVRPEVFVFELAGRDLFDLERALHRDLVPLGNGLVIDAKCLCERVFAAEMANDLFEGFVHGS